MLLTAGATGKLPVPSSWIVQSNYPGAEVILGCRGVRRVGNARGNVQRVGRTAGCWNIVLLREPAGPVGKVIVAQVKIGLLLKSS